MRARTRLDDEWTHGADADHLLADVRDDVARRVDDAGVGADAVDDAGRADDADVGPHPHVRDDVVRDAGTAQLERQQSRQPQLVHHADGPLVAARGTDDGRPSRLSVLYGAGRCSELPPPPASLLPC